ncbi:MAG: O-methyltransferase [Mycobacteriales bacterium]
MTVAGTAAYHGRADLPPRVAEAVAAATGAGFGYSCLPEQGELLRLLAAGVGPGAIGETGTGCGVGLAWLACGARPEARLVSVERDAGRARIAAGLFGADPRVTVRTGDWSELRADGPFDLLVLDGGGQGKGDEPPLRPEEWLRPGGLLVIDDFTPMTGWPPTLDGVADTPACTGSTTPASAPPELRLTPTAATIVATFTG